MKTKDFFKKYLRVIMYWAAALAFNTLLYVAFKNTDALIFSGGVCFIICYAVTLFVHYDFFKSESSKPKHSKPERYIFHSIELSDYEIYAIGDNETHKIICHLNYDNDPEYNKELGNRIVNLLNENEL